MLPEDFGQSFSPGPSLTVPTATFTTSQGDLSVCCSVLLVISFCNMLQSTKYFKKVALNYLDILDGLQN